MIILADHCVYGKTIRVLREAGHNVIRLMDVASPSSDDETVISLAASHHAVLISNDKDFSDIVQYPPKNHRGIIVLRITPQSEDVVHRTLIRLLQKKTIEKIQGSLFVIRGNKVRIRSR